MHEHSDDAIPHGARCYCCGRYYDMNEVHVGAYTDYYLVNGAESSCPSCFSQIIYGVADPIRDNLLYRRLFTDTPFSRLLRDFSLWAEPARPASRES